MTATALPHRHVLALLLASLSMFGPFCIDAIFPAFPAIAAQFGASPLAMQQTISVYLVSYAAMSLLLGAFSDAWGRRRVILCGVMVFLVACVGCALAQSMPMLLLFRALQGTSAGLGLIVGRALVRDCFEGAQAQKLMAQISMIFGVAPAAAPIVGAWLVSLGSWHTLFWAMAGFAAVLLLLCFFVLPETHPPEQRLPLSPRPLLARYATIIVDPGFLLLAGTIVLSFAGLFLYVASAPGFILTVLRLAPDQFYWLFVPAISGLVLGSILAGRMAGRVSVRMTLNIGNAIMLGAAFLNVLIATTVIPARVPWAVLPIGVAGIGLNFIAPTVNLLVIDRFPRFRGSASSVQAFLSLSFCAMLAGLGSPWLGNDAMSLALASLVLYGLGFVAWRGYRWRIKRMPNADTPAES
ncbi:MAG TPA: multidrug effflux MFS transporter [Candidatus Acidoferrum sp.]|nr:multidrug effflux MFS transporter [Candidatus Acidoferrum sp.]